MPHTKIANSGFKNINYPVHRRRKIGKNVYLTNYPEGCGIKIIIELAWEFLDGSKNTTVTRKFKQGGVTEENIYNLVVATIPEYPQWYFEKSEGVILTPHIIWNRGHKGCAYDNLGVKGDPSRRGVLSDEHYTRSAALIPYASAVQSLWSSKEIITIAELRKACIS